MCMCVLCVLCVRLCASIPGGAHHCGEPTGSLIRRAISAAQGYEHTQTVPNAEPLEVDLKGLFAFDESTVFDERGRLVW